MGAYFISTSALEQVQGFAWQKDSTRKIRIEAPRLVMQFSEPAMWPLSRMEFGNEHNPDGQSSKP